VAADLTGEFRLQVGEPNVTGPTLRTDDDGMRALVVGKSRVGPPDDRISLSLIFCWRCIAPNSAKS